MSALDEMTTAFVFGFDQPLRENDKTYQDITDVGIYIDPHLTKHGEYGVYGWVAFKNTSLRLGNSVAWKISGSDFTDEDLKESILRRFEEKCDFANRKENECSKSIQKPT